MWRAFLPTIGGRSVVPRYQEALPRLGVKESLGVCENSVYFDIFTISEASIFTNLSRRVVRGLESCFTLVNS